MVGEPQRSEGCCTSQLQRLRWNVGSKPLCNYPWARLSRSVIGSQRVETLVGANRGLLPRSRAEAESVPVAGKAQRLE